jgi:hypothetical protein
VGGWVYGLVEWIELIVSVPCGKFKVEFLEIERSVNSMKLYKEKYAGVFSTKLYGTEIFRRFF